MKSEDITTIEREIEILGVIKHENCEKSYYLYNSR